MVRDIPTAQDFHDAGVEFSMMAYSNIIDLLVVFEEWEEYSEDQDVLENYWNSSKGKLKNAASLLHQGIDFLLKSKICEVSAFLLIDNSPEKIPGNNKNAELSYSDFFSHDASKLPKIYDAYCTPKLSDRFKQLYEESRKRRNKIIHTIDSHLKLEVNSMILESIELIQYFLKTNWLKLRRDFLESSPEFHLHYEEDAITQKVIWEFSALKKILPNKVFLNVYGVSKKLRFYTCPECSHSDYISHPSETVYLNPNTPQSTSAMCLACNTTLDVLRDPCVSNGCRSNVISEETGNCMVCGESND